MEEKPKTKGERGSGREEGVRKLENKGTFESYQQHCTPTLKFTERKDTRTLDQNICQFNYDLK